MSAPHFREDGMKFTLRRGHGIGIGGVGIEMLPSGDLHGVGVGIGMGCWCSESW